MGRIKVLDQQTVNEIAAGEVVERPASVVKELIENSIDAGARRIEIRIEQGGTKKIEVIDDGEGMSREDALLAVNQHSTSKLFKIGDLSRLSTYGFRGEALASIGSVSKLTIRTKRNDEAVGTLVIVDFGAPPEVSDTGAPTGTTVIVEDLFSNVPARKKNLPSQQTELAHTESIVTKYAIAWPEVSFDLVSNGKQMLSFRGPDRSSRILELVGPRAAKSLIDFSKEEGQLKVSGAFTKIDVSKGSASSIHLFVNRRPISNSMLLSAIADGYGTRLMRGRYPIGYLMLDIPPNEIDINVHPTKREIKFSNPEMVRKSVLQAIEEAFSGLDSTPQLGDIMDYVRIGKATEKLEQGIPRHDFQARIETVDAVSESAPPLTPLFQLFDTYIVARGLVDDSIVVIDQHAAAERITYERILESLGQGDRRFQQLISPSILELTASEKVALEENKEHLRNIGFEIEEFGGGSYRLTSVPIVLGVEQGEASLKAVLDDVSKAGRRRPLGEELIWKVACHGSIRAGEDLSRQQMLALIVDLFKTKNPYNCEHGRPTMISLGISDLERLFKRQI